MYDFEATYLQITRVLANDYCVSLTQDLQSKSLRTKTKHKFLTSYLTLALCHEKKLTMITRFNGFLRVYDDIFLSRFEEYKLDAVPKKASLSSETFVYSYQIEEEEETDFVPNVSHILSIIKVRLWKKVDDSRILQES